MVMHHVPQVTSQTLNANKMPFLFLYFFKLQVLCGTVQPRVPCVNCLILQCICYKTRTNLKPSSESGLWNQFRGLNPFDLLPNLDIQAGLLTRYQCIN